MYLKYSFFLILIQITVYGKASTARRKMSCDPATIQRELFLMIDIQDDLYDLEEEVTGVTA